MRPCPASICRRLEVTKGQVLKFWVTGTEAGDYGRYQLSLDLQLPGSNFKTANYLGEASTINVSDSTVGYPRTFRSSCNGGKVDDGPDMVSPRCTASTLGLCRAAWRCQRPAAWAAATQPPPRLPRTVAHCVPCLCPQYFSYPASANTTVTAKVCGEGYFQPSVTIFEQATTEGGMPTQLACGTCGSPAV